MEQKNGKPAWRPTNPHDRFCRRTVYHPFHASDFLRSYGDPVLATDGTFIEHLSDIFRHVTESGLDERR